MEFNILQYISALYGNSTICVHFVFLTEPYFFFSDIKYIYKAIIWTVVELLLLFGNSFK